MSDPALTPRQQSAQSTALERIRTCHRGRKKALDLSNLGLLRLPPEIGQLTALTLLYLHGNQLPEQPAGLAWKLAKVGAIVSAQQSRP